MNHEKLVKSRFICLFLVIVSSVKNNKKCYNLSISLLTDLVPMKTAKQRIAIDTTKNTIEKSKCCSCLLAR